MVDWKAKRFWTQATVTEVDGGYAVKLDERPVKTPAKASLIVPTAAMAQVIAEEWDAQEGEIDPRNMPVTRSANAAIDKVSRQHAEVAELIAAYGDADLLCYRASNPAELTQRQAETWDPLLNWAASELDARLTPVFGVVHQAQDKKTLAALSTRVREMDAFCLTAFHDLVSLSGSLVIGFAAIHGFCDVEELWQASRVDENWQQEQWGSDDEASEVASRKRHEFIAAKRFYDLSQAS